MGSVNKRNATEMTPCDSSVKRTALTGSAQALSTSGRAIHIKTAGNIVGQLLEESVDVTEDYEIGWHCVAFKSITSSTAVGFIHH